MTDLLHTGPEPFQYPRGGAQEEYGSAVWTELGFGLGDARGWASQSSTDIQATFAEHAKPAKRKYCKKATAAPLPKETADQVVPSSFSIVEIE